MPKEMNLTRDQRRFLAETFIAELKNVEIMPGQKICKRLGPSLQTWLMDVTRAYFEVFPVMGDVITEKIEDEKGNETVKETYEFKLELEIPGISSRKIKLVREFPKEKMDHV